MNEWKKIHREPPITELNRSKAKLKYAYNDCTALTNRDLQNEFHCSYAYIQKCIGEGMPHYLVGDGVRFDLEKCQAWHRGEVVV
jgi:hypothetical protein